MSFETNMVLPNIYHIRDAMGVCMTLLVGTSRALLVDTGYGMEDVQAFVRTITNLPLTVLLTHGHHDHVLGARWFDETFMFREDIPDFLTYTGEITRRRVLDSALAKGLDTPEDFLTAEIPLPQPLNEGLLDLGGLSVRIIRCPGHTPGSAVVYVPAHALLLTADDWNPCTWLFFPAALPVHRYLANMRALAKLPFRQVLCSHQPALYARGMLDAFLTALTDDALRAARPVKIPPYEGTDTRQADLPEGQMLVFDWIKAQL